MSVFDIIRDTQTCLPVDKNESVNLSHYEIPAMGPDWALNLDFLAVKWVNVL